VHGTKFGLTDHDRH